MTQRLVSLYFYPATHKPPSPSDTGASQAEAGGGAGPKARDVAMGQQSSGGARQALKKVACPCCCSHLRGLRRAQEQTWGMGPGERGQSGPLPVRQSAVNGMKTVRRRQPRTETVTPAGMPDSPSHEGRSHSLACRAVASIRWHPYLSIHENTWVKNLDADADCSDGCQALRRDSQWVRNKQLAIKKCPSALATLKARTITHAG